MEPGVGGSILGAWGKTGVSLEEAGRGTSMGKGPRASMAPQRPTVRPECRQRQHWWDLRLFSSQHVLIDTAMCQDREIVVNRSRGQRPLNLEGW